MPKKNQKANQRNITLRGDGGVLISAPNGDVIQYDDSGLVFRLSDKVIRDIAQRLKALQPDHVTTARPDAEKKCDSQQQILLKDAEILGDLDAWHVIQEGDWLMFQANLADGNGPRGYRRPVGGGDVIADAPGAVLGMLSIGGPRRAVGVDGVNDFRYHIVAPNDDIGSAGLAGSALAEIGTGFSNLREQTRDSLIAQAVLHGRFSANRALPLIMVRCEVDQSVSADALAKGIAFDNFMVAAETLANVAKTMGKPPRILAVGLDYCIEDTTSTGTKYRDGIYGLMRKIELGLGKLGYKKPCFVSLFECGGLKSDAGCHTQEQWELATNPAGFDLIYSAPGYMFEQTTYGRPTAAALGQMAEMDGYAIEACLEVPRNEEEISAGVGQWCCPSFLLAEWDRSAKGKDTHTIRVTANALTGLIIDQAPDFGNSELAGFTLENVENGARFVALRVCPDNPLDILLDCDIAPEGDNIRLHYACGQKAKSEDMDDQVGFPHNRGCVRDSWQADSADGRRLYRWALPCILPVH
ncbi:MAG: hypothetical protein V3V25_08610 [Paracoccaceae bacterium]